MKFGECPLQQCQRMKQGKVSFLVDLHVQFDIKFRGAATLKHELTPSFSFNKDVLIIRRRSRLGHTIRG